MYVNVITCIIKIPAYKSTEREIHILKT